MAIIIRQSYIDKIERFLGKETIIVLVGQRRVGKSCMMKMIRDRKISDSSNNIIYIDKEKREFEHIKNYSTCLYQYILPQYPIFSPLFFSSLTPHPKTKTLNVITLRCNNTTGGRRSGCPFTINVLTFLKTRWFPHYKCEGMDEETNTSRGELSHPRHMSHHKDRRTLKSVGYRYTDSHTMYISTPTLNL